jgi:hypothetical protein
MRGNSQPAFAGTIGSNTAEASRLRFLLEILIALFQNGCGTVSQPVFTARDRAPLPAVVENLSDTLPLSHLAEDAI